MFNCCSINLFLRGSFITNCLQSGCEDVEFAVELINQLVQAFLAAHDTRAQVRRHALEIQLTEIANILHMTS